jgi:YjbE family integral membrane protein
MDEFMTPAFWTGFLTIIGIDIILSGDNAVVIALAAHSLPPRQQKSAVFWGAGAAVMLRVLMASVALQLLRLPYLKLAGGLLLLWIAVKLLTPQDEDLNIAPAEHLAAAIKTIVVADFVMSLDNVVAVAGAAKGSVLLLAIGLVISIPLVVFGATMLMKWMERWPSIITGGSAILGWVAVEMLITDPMVEPYLQGTPGYVHYLMAVVGAVFVVAVGKWFAVRSKIERSKKVA